MGLSLVLLILACSKTQEGININNQTIEPTCYTDEIEIFPKDFIHENTGISFQYPSYWEFYFDHENRSQVLTDSCADIIIYRFNKDVFADNLNEYKSLALYINCLSELKEFDEANTFSESLSEDALKDRSIKSALKNLELKKNFKMDSNIDELKKQHLKKPDDIKIILKLSDQFFSENLHDEAFELLINNYNKNKEKIKNKILEYFEALGQDNNKTQEYRKRFSSIMFS